MIQLGRVLMLILTILVPSRATTEPRPIDPPVRECLLPRDQRTIRVQEGDDVKSARPALTTCPGFTPRAMTTHPRALGP